MSLSQRSGLEYLLTNKAVKILGGDKQDVKSFYVENSDNETKSTKIIQPIIKKCRSDQT